jgi:hypothetical protein
VKRAALIGLLVLACCSSDLDRLQAQATAVAAAAQPRLVALIVRVYALKRGFGNRRDWQKLLRISQMANDELGLQPFEQVVPHGPSWKPGPATLLGIAPYILVQADVLAKAGKRHDLEFLVQDERRRYEEGISSVDKHLIQVEHLLAEPPPAP